MTKQIRTVTVVGAGGAMGGTIAAMLANAGITVHALDRVPANDKDPMYGKMMAAGGDRNFVAREKIEKMKKIINPMDDILNAGFMHPSNADRIILGNVEDDLEKAVKESDAVFEVIWDKPEAKAQLFEMVDRVMKPGTLVFSNTSTIPWATMARGRSEEFQKNFMIAHWFNPPRFMHLLETVSGPKTDPEVVKFATEFFDKTLGKHVEPCKDTPFFKGNRMGMYFVMRAATAAMEQGIKIDEVDALLGKPFGMGDAGVFGMVDMVGLGLVPDLARNAATMLPKTDEFHNMNYPRVMRLIDGLIAQGFTGRAAGGGFFRPKRDEDGKSVKNKKGKTVLQAVDLTTGEYQDAGEHKPKAAAEGKKGPRAVLDFGDRYSNYAWTVVRDTILYALNRVP